MKQSSTLNSGLFLYFSVTDSQWQDYTCLARCLHRKHTQFLLNNETVHIQERTGLECTELDTQNERWGVGVSWNYDIRDNEMYFCYCHFPLTQYLITVKAEAFGNVCT